MHGALTGRYDSLASDIRTALRDADMKVSDVERSGLSVVANFDSANARDDATSELRRRIPNMEFSDGTRSEEHTSELQSLMRISYAVFCLQKKTQSKFIESNIQQK